MNIRLLEIENEIDILLTEIIVPLRKKEINEQAFEKLFNILDESTYLLENKSVISKKFAGLLFFAYTQIETQGKYAKYPDPIFEKLGLLKNRIRNILGYII